MSFLLLLIFLLCLMHVLYATKICFKQKLNFKEPSLSIDLYEYKFHYSWYLNIKWFEKYTALYCFICIYYNFSFFKENKTCI